MKNKNENHWAKLRYITLIDGIVDLCKFEIEIYNSKNIYTIIRDGNEEQNKRKRPVYDGPKEAIF